MSRAARKPHRSIQIASAGGEPMIHALAESVSWSSPHDEETQQQQQADAAISAPAYASSVSSSSTQTIESAGFGWASLLTFSWVSPLLARGVARGHLESPQDFLTLRGRDSAAFWAQAFERAWEGAIARAEAENEAAAEEDAESDDRDGSSIDLSQMPRRPSRSAKQASLPWTLFSCFGWRFLAQGFLKLLSDSLAFSGPVLLGLLVSWIESYHDHPSTAAGSETEPEARWHGYLYASVLVLGVLLNAFFSSQYNFRIRRIGMHLRACVVTRIYATSLGLTAAARAGFSSGAVTNSMSTDTDRAVDLTISVHELWSLPVQVGIALWLLYREVGLALLAGLGVVVVLIPVNGLITRAIGRVSRRMMTAKDERLSLLGELLRNLRPVRMLGLESRFAHRITTVREREIACLATRKYLDALCVFFWAVTPVLVSLATFTTYSLASHEPLTASKVFASLALFNILIRPLNAYPWVINGMVEGMVSLRRVEKFLRGETIQRAESRRRRRGDASVASTSRSNSVAAMDHASNDGIGGTHDAALCVACLEGSFNFVAKKADDTSSSSAASPLPPHALSSLSLHIRAGEIVVVHGVVGSGKSSLLQALLGELLPASRSCVRRVVSPVAFVAQEVWLPHATLRDVILFHSPYSAARYNAVLDACALRPDLAEMPGGEFSEVGESGLNLSGGQRVRIAIARAVYACLSGMDNEEDDAGSESAPRLMLLDDPLSAVDAHVAAHLIRSLFGSSGLLRVHGHRTAVVIVSHHVDLLRGSADRILEMQAGKIVREEIGGGEQQEADLHSAAASVAPAAATSSPSSAIASSPATPSPAVAATAAAPTSDVDPEAASEKLLLEKGYLTSAEARARGTIRHRVLSAYLHWVGLGLCGWIFLSMVLMQASKNGSDWWLSYWVEHATPDDGDESTVSQGDTDYYLRIYAYLAAGNSCAALFRSFIFAFGGLVAARRSFLALLAAVSRAPTSWFDITPLGRVLNRFSTDTYAIDENIPFQSNIFLAQSFMLLGSLAVIAFVVPAVLVMLPILSLVYATIQGRYRSASREVRRLDNVTRSPLYSSFQESLSGFLHIRCFDRADVYLRRNLTILEENQTIYFAGLGLSQWLNVRLQCIGVSVVTTVCFASVLIVLYPSSWSRWILNPSLAGLAIAYALPLTDNLNGLIGSGTETEKEVVSVERTVEYTSIKGEDQEEDDEAIEMEDTEENEENPQTRGKSKRQAMPMGFINEVSLVLFLSFFVLFSFPRIRIARQKCLLSAPLAARHFMGAVTRLILIMRQNATFGHIQRRIDLSFFAHMLFSACKVKDIRPTFCISPLFRLRCDSRPVSHPFVLCVLFLGFAIIPACANCITALSPRGHTGSGRPSSFLASLWIHPFRSRESAVSYGSLTGVGQCLFHH